MNETKLPPLTEAEVEAAAALDEAASRENVLLLEMFPDRIRQIAETQAAQALCVDPTQAEIEQARRYGIVK